LVHDNDKALGDSASHLALSTLPTGQRDFAESLVIVRAVVRTLSTDRLHECYGTRRTPPGNGYALDIENTIRLVLAVSTSQTSDATTNFTILASSSGSIWDIKDRLRPSSLLQFFITLKPNNQTNTTKQSLPTKPPANMQLSKIFFLAAAASSATAAPTAEPVELEARTSGIQCQHHGGKWKYGWEGAAPGEKYTCKTTGLIVCALQASF
jgi:hypothetical protein